MQHYAMETIDAGQNNPDIGLGHTQNDANQMSQKLEGNPSINSLENTRNIMDDDSIKSILFTTEFENDNLLQDDEMEKILSNNVCKCAQEWKEYSQIDGVVSHDCYVKMNNFHETEEWCCKPRLIHKKKHATVEMFAQFITSLSTCELHKAQEERCLKHSIKITSKETELQHVKRLGCTIGPNAKIAAPSIYVEKINSTAGLHRGIIEIKKQVTFEKDAKSKVLMIHATVDDAKETDSKLIDTRFEGFKHMSFKLSTASQRMAAMQTND